MKKWFLPFAAVMLLAGCNNNDGKDNPEESMKDNGTQELGKDPTLGEDNNHEQDGNTDSTEQNNSKVYLKKDFLNELSTGKMPGSDIQLGASEDDVRSKMGDPKSEEDVEGVNFLSYDKYAYGVKGGKVVSVAYHIPDSDQATPNDFIESWGAPATEGSRYNNAPGTYTLTYEFVKDSIVTVKSEKQDKIMDAIIVNQK